MKTILFLLFTLIGISAFSQGGIRSLKTTSDKIIFKDLSGSGNKVIGIDNNGRSKKISVDGVTIFLTNDTLSASASDVTSTLTSGWTVKWDGTKFVNYYNPAVQTLTGTSPTWNASLGVDATITITGNTSVSMQNLIDGTSGVLSITNPATVYKVKFLGYNLKIAANLTYDSNGITLKGLTTPQSLGWKYIGGFLLIHGTYYNSITF